MFCCKLYQVGHCDSAEAYCHANARQDLHGLLKRELEKMYLSQLVRWLDDALNFNISSWAGRLTR